MSHQKKLTEGTMIALGFEKIKPLGNTNAVWWVDNKRGITFYSLPTAKKLFKGIEERAEERGVEKARDAMIKALGLCWCKPLKGSDIGHIEE